MGKSSPRNPLWPDWFDGEKIDEVTFCHELIRNHPMKCIENRFFTPDGPVEDEAELKQLILKEIQAFIIHGLSKRVANLLESLRIIGGRKAMQGERQDVDFPVTRKQCGQIDHIVFP